MGRYKPFLPVILILLLPSLLLWKIFFLKYVLLPADVLSIWKPWKVHFEKIEYVHFITDPIMQHYPWRVYTANAIKNGEFPLWNPYILSGHPFLANAQSAIFYPFNVLFLLFSPPCAYTLYILLHLYLAGIFTYLCLKQFNISSFSSFLGSISFMFSGFYFSWLEIITVPAALTYLPITFYFAEKFIKDRSKKYMGFLGLATGCMALSGHPQLIQYNVFVLLLYFTLRSFLEKDRQMAVLAFLSVMTGLLISSANTLPVIELGQKSFRKVYEYGEVSGFPLSRIVTFFIPFFFNDEVDLETCGYLGSIPFLFLLCGVLMAPLRKENKPFLTCVLMWVIIVVLLFKTPLYEIFYALPSNKMFNSTTRFLGVFCFFSSIIFAASLDFFTTQRQNKKLWVFLERASVIIVCFLLCAVFVQKNTLFRLPLTPDHNLFTFLCFYFVLLSCAWFYVKNILSLRTLKFAIALIVCLDIFIFAYKTNPNQVPRSFVFPEVKSIQVLARMAGRDRVIRYRPHQLVFPNMLLLYRIFDVQGYDSLVFKDYDKLFRTLFPQPFTNFISGPSDPKHLEMPVLNFLNIKYLLSGSPILTLPQNIRQVYSDKKEMVIYENKDVLPRAYFVNQTKKIMKGDKILQALASKAFKPQEYIILSENHPKPSGGILESEVKVVSYKHNSVLMECAANKNAYLVMSDVYYPGWKVYVDGKQGKIYKANYCFRAVYLTAGRHTVKFVYAPLSFKMGVLLSLTGLVISLWLIFGDFRRRHPFPSNAAQR